MMGKNIESPWNIHQKAPLIGGFNGFNPSQKTLEIGYQHPISPISMVEKNEFSSVIAMTKRPKDCAGRIDNSQGTQAL